MNLMPVPKSFVASLGLLAYSLTWSAATACAAPPTFAHVIRQVQPKIVKIWGAGGYRGLEPYQSGFLISAEGHVLTAWSYVLDSDEISVILNDGRKFIGKLLGADPKLEIAVLKIEATDLPFFELGQAATAVEGAKVLAFSNLYGVATGDEPVSVQHGFVSSKTRLEARRGVFDTPYVGPVYVVDAITNNPGAAGGALTDGQGQLLGILGKELRNTRNNTWLNYALPAAELVSSVEEIRAGKSVRRDLQAGPPKPKEATNLELLGVVLVPNILERTPPFVDEVRPGSPAERAGLRPDDLVLFVGEHLVQSCNGLKTELEYIDRVDDVVLTVMRQRELVQIVIKAPAQ